MSSQPVSGNQVLKKVVRSCRKASGEMAAMVLIWPMLEEDRLVWRGARVDGDLRSRIVEASQKVGAETIDL